MAKKTKNGIISQILTILVPVDAVVMLVAIILAAIGGYESEVIWMVLAGTLVVALAGMWYGWRSARFSGIGGKVAYIICVAVILVGMVFPPLYFFA